jgi:hypothetical protein
MFTLLRDRFGSAQVSCVKLPAAVAFPTDDRLLQRIEEARRALPRNNMKALWHSRARECVVHRPELRANEADLQLRPRAEFAPAAIERVRVARAELRSTLSRMNQLYSSGRAAAN